MTKEQALRASYIDSTILKAEAKSADIIDLCAEARTYGFASVCINPIYVPLAHVALAGSTVKVCTVIGFPLGAMTSSAKAFEARDAILHGADEVDMVVSIGKVREHDREYVTKDIQGVVKAAKDANSKALVKVIIEACYLTDSEKIFACECAEKAGADFVKTSTGFGSGGANAHDVALMRETVGERLGVKAAGGIRTREDFDKMIKAGASRIGTSHGKELI